MFKQLIHKLFHPPKEKHIHTYIHNSMEVEHDSWGGFIVANYETTCPQCAMKGTRQVIFVFDEPEYLKTVKQCKDYKGE